MFARASQPAVASTEDAPLDSYHQALLDYQEKMLNGNSDSDASDVDDGTNSTKSAKKNLKGVVSSIAVATVPFGLLGAAVGGYAVYSQSGGAATPAGSEEPISGKAVALFGSGEISSCDACSSLGKNHWSLSFGCVKKDGRISNCLEWLGYVADPRCREICSSATAKEKDAKCTLIIGSTSGDDNAPILPSTCGSYQKYVEGLGLAPIDLLTQCSSRCSSSSSSSTDNCALSNIWKTCGDYNQFQKAQEPVCGDTYMNPICFNTAKKQVETYEYFEYERVQPHTFPLCDWQGQCDGSNAKLSSCATMINSNDGKSKVAQVKTCALYLYELSSNPGTNSSNASSINGSASTSEEIISSASSAAKSLAEPSQNGFEYPKCKDLEHCDDSAYCINDDHDGKLVTCGDFYGHLSDPECASLCSTSTVPENAKCVQTFSTPLERFDFPNPSIAKCRARQGKESSAKMCNDINNEKDVLSNCPYKDCELVMDTAVPTTCGDWNKLAHAECQSICESEGEISCDIFGTKRICTDYYKVDLDHGPVCGNGLPRFSTLTPKSACFNDTTKRVETYEFFQLESYYSYTVPSCASQCDGSNAPSSRCVTELDSKDGTKVIKEQTCQFYKYELQKEKV